MKTNAECNAAFDYTKSFVMRLLDCAKRGVAAGKDLKQVYDDTRRELDPIYGQVFIYEHCIPFDVSRAFDEANGLAHPRIWTAERDIEMWRSLQT
jgi:hypothetical protein